MASQDKSDFAPRIDLCKLNYPSDSITIRDLRRIYPQGFTQHETDPRHVPFFNSDLSDEFSTMLEFERTLAEYAFDEALGRPIIPVTVFAERKDLRRFVKEYYISHQIAKGPQEARELLRGLEAEAAEQALQHNPGRRP